MIFPQGEVRPPTVGELTNTTYYTTNVILTQTDITPAPPTASSNATGGIGKYPVMIVIISSQ